MRNNLNLLSMSDRRRMLRNDRLWQWGRIWVILAIGLSVATLFAWQRGQQASVELTMYQHADRPNQKMFKQLQTLRAHVTEVSRREERIAELDDNVRMLDMLGLISDAASACDGEVQVRSFQFGSTKASATQRIQNMTIEGVALNVTRITQFVDTLRKTNAYELIDLKPTEKHDIGDKSGYRFQVDCRTH